MILPVPWAHDRARFICHQLEVSFNDLMGRCRAPDVVRARRIVTVILYDFCGPTLERLSFPEVAASVGKANHSTIITQYRRANEEPEVVAEAEALAARFGWRRHRC